MKKRILLWAVCLLCMTALLCFAVSAKTVSDTCGENVKWSLDTDTGLLDITGTGPMEDYILEPYAPWFSLCNSIKTLRIASGVTTVGDWAFNYCDNLTDITLGDTITSIGFRSFFDCNGFKSVTIPDSVRSIGARAFYNCDGLENVVIPDSVTDLGKEAFYSCGNLISVTLGDNVSAIGMKTFAQCENLMNATLGDSITAIGEEAFYGCTYLGNITIPDGVTDIGKDAFCGCGGFTSITIPDSVRSIGDGAFNCCTGLTDITIGSGVTTIGNYAFDWCRKLTDFTIYSTDAVFPDSANLFSNHSADLVFTCYKDSTAEAYAVKYGIKVNYLPEICTAHEFTVLVSAEIPASDGMNGKTAVYQCAHCDATTGGEVIRALLYDSCDFDGDGVVEATEVLFSLRNLLNGDTEALPDLNGDGEFTLIDVLCMLRLCVV